MLLLLFEIGNGRYALDVNQIIEIVPLVKCKKIPRSPDYVVGLMNYRGKGTPVIDLNQIVDSIPFKDVLSTRIILINNPIAVKDKRPLALIANNVIETVRIEMTKPPLSGFIMDNSLYDDAVNTETSDMIQWFDPKKMLPVKEISLLFEEEE
jgi:chemotaxis-related protein WspB